MKKELKEEWVKALRSGKYKQGREMLRKNVNGEDYYCCLGVLADICGPHIEKNFKWKSHRVFVSFEEKSEHFILVDETGKRRDNSTDGPHEYEGVLCSQMGSQMLGLEGLALVGLDASYASYLARQNDFGTSFGAIADMIEKRYPALPETDAFPEKN